MSLEKNISNYIKEKGVNLSAMSRQTGIPYMALYNSLMNEKRGRPLKGRELVNICIFLGKDPREFADHNKSEAEKEAV